MKFLCSFLFPGLLMGLGLVLSSCTTPVESVDAKDLRVGQSYAVAKSYASFYVEPNRSVFDPPYRSLSSGDRVQLVEVNAREAKVKLSDGVVGYVDPAILGVSGRKKVVTPKKKDEGGSSGAKPVSSGSSGARANPSWVKKDGAASSKPGPKPVVRPEAKPEVKPEAKPEVRPEPKPEVKPEPKPSTEGAGNGGSGANGGSGGPELPPRPGTEPKINEGSIDDFPLQPLR